MTHEERQKRLKYWTPEKIFALRKRLGLAQQAFGLKLGYSPTRAKISVSEIENAKKRPGPHTLEMLEQLRKRHNITFLRNAKETDG